jgi:hypothetical protein
MPSLINLFTLVVSVRADTFANNHLSKYLLSSNPMSSFGLHM